MAPGPVATSPPLLPLLPEAAFVPRIVRRPPGPLRRWVCVVSLIKNHDVSLNVRIAVNNKPWSFDLPLDLSKGNLNATTRPRSRTSFATDDHVELIPHIVIP